MDELWLAIFGRRRNVLASRAVLALSAVLIASMTSVSAQPTVPGLPGSVGLTPQGDALLEAPPEPPPASPCAADRLLTRRTRGMTWDVYRHSGEFHVETVDLAIPGRGLDFVWARKYRSRVGPRTEQGHGWDFSYNIRVVRQGSAIVLHDGNSRVDTYSLRGDGTFTAPQFFREGRFGADGTFTLSFSDGGIWQFLPFDDGPAQGKVLKIADRNGNRLSFDYDALGRLSAITDTLDRTILVAYDASGLIESVTDFTGRRVTYAYYRAGDAGGSDADLKSVTSPPVVGTPHGNDFPGGKTTVYTYSRGFGSGALNHNLLTITDPKGQTFLNNVYGNAPGVTFDRVTRQVLGTPGDTIDYVYVTQPRLAGGGRPGIKTIVNDRMGNVEELFFDGTNRCTRLREFTGRSDPDQPTTETSNRPSGKLRPDDPVFFETRVEYNADSLPTLIVHPNGTLTRIVHELDVNPQATWRSRGNVRDRHRLPGSHLPAGDQPSLDELYEYDPATNYVTRAVDPRGGETRHAYDSRGNRTRTEHRIPSIVEEFEYNEFGQLTAHVLPDNGGGSRRRDEYSYYSAADGFQNGYLRQCTVDAGGFSIARRFEYDPAGNVIRAIDPRGHDTLIVRNALDQAVRVVSREVTDGSGVRYERDHSYDANDNLVRIDMQNRDEQGIIQPNARFTTTHEYEVLNHRVRTTEEVADGQTVSTEFGYDANRNRTLVRHGEATAGVDPFNVVRTSFDERDRVFQVVRAPGSASQSTSQQDYDGNGNRRASRRGLEASPRVTQRSFDAYDRLVESTDPMGNVTVIRYDANGNRVSVQVDGELTDVGGSAANARLYEASFQFDAMDRATLAAVEHFDTATQAPIGDGQSLTMIEYSDASRVTRVVDDNGNATLYRYDTAHRPSLTIDAKGNSVSYTYDASSNVVMMTEIDRSDLLNPDRSFVTIGEYDNVDRLVRTIDNAGNVRSFGYDSRGNRVVETDARGNVSRFAFDGLGRPVETVHFLTDTGDGSGAVIDSITSALFWDASSRLIGQSDDNFNVTTHGYDSLNRRVATVHADGTAESSTFDVQDNRIAARDANESQWTATYDLADRLTVRSIFPGPGVLGTTLESYRWDGLSRLVRAADDDSAITLSYDSLSHPTTATQRVVPGGPLRTVSRTYDGVGNEVGLVYPGLRPIVRTFDALNRPLLIRDPSGGPTGVVGGYSYVGRSLVERLDFGNRTHLDVQYDGVRRIAGTRHAVTQTGAAIDERLIDWDPEWNKLGVQSPIGFPPDQRTFGYDSADRLVRFDTVPSGPFVSYNLDGVGNRAFVSGPTGGFYFMEPSLPEPADFQMNQYTQTPLDSREYDRNGNLVHIPIRARQAGYDYRDQLVEFSDSAAGVSAAYRYDCFGRRIEKNVNGVVTRFYYDGWQEIEEQSAGGATLATYVWGGSMGLIQMRRGATRYTFHADDLGSTVAVTDASRNVVERYEYDDFGKPEFLDAFGSTIPASQIGNPFLFRGLRFDDESGYLRGGSRTLDPSVGRFVSRSPGGSWVDPIGLGNGYTFAGNNPYSHGSGCGLTVHGSTAGSDQFWVTVSVSSVCPHCGGCNGHHFPGCPFYDCGCGHGPGCPGFGPPPPFPEGPSVPDDDGPIILGDVPGYILPPRSSPPAAPPGQRTFGPMRDSDLAPVDKSRSGPEHDSSPPAPDPSPARPPDGYMPDGTPYWLMKGSIFPGMQDSHFASVRDSGFISFCALDGVTQEANVRNPYTEDDEVLRFLLNEFDLTMLFGPRLPWLTEAEQNERFEKEARDMNQRHAKRERELRRLIRQTPR